MQSSWGLGGKSGHFRHSLHAHERQWSCLGVCPCPSAVVARSARSKNGRRGRGNRQGSLANMGISLVAQKPRFLPPSAPKLASPCIPLCITPHFGFCPPSAFYAPSGLARQPFYMVLSLWRICLCSALAFTLAHLAPFCPLCPFGGLPISLAFYIWLWAMPLVCRFFARAFQLPWGCLGGSGSGTLRFTLSLALICRVSGSGLLWAN